MFTFLDIFCLAVFVANLCLPLAVVLFTFPFAVYLYLFAADKAQGEEPKKLVEHYKSAMKFSAVEDVKIVKPDYDMSCISLVQPLLGIEGNRRRAWEEYSDLIK